MTEATLIPLLQADQRERWQRGEHTPVESYLDERPALHSDPDGLLDLIYHEIVLREESGDTPRLPEYLRRFPHFADEIRRLFEVHQVLEDEPLEDELPPTKRSSVSESQQVPEVSAIPGGIAGYEVEGELGRGGMGVVYRARHLGLNRLVALKMILAGPHAGRRELARLRAEAEAAARLHHPNITQIYTIEEHEGLPFLTLELVEGVSLHEHVGRQPQQPARAATLVETLALAVHYAHEHGVIHRDLKPGNILVAADGTPKVTDFGLAKLLDAEPGRGAGGLTGTEALVGTPNYMAPEQARGRVKDVGPATDIYSLGAILYELLTGRPPFRGSTLLDTIDQVRHREPIAPRRLRPGVPRDLETICLKCLEKAPARRYSSASDLADDLRRFLNFEPIRARPTSWWQRTAKWARRRPAAATLTAVAAILILGVVATVAWDWVQESRRLDRLRVEVQADWHRGQEAMRQEDWAEAKHQFAIGLNRIGEEPSLQERRATLEILDAEASRRLKEEETRRRTQKLYRDFLAARDEAIFQGIAADAPDALATGMNADAVRAAFAASAHTALALVACDLEGGDAWAPPRELSDSQKAEVTAGCYTILVLLADAAAARNASVEGLRLLSRAEQIGPSTHAAAAREAEYLRQNGQQDRAQQVRRRTGDRSLAGALDFFLVGHAHLQRGEIPLATGAFESALAAQPDHFWANCCLAVCELRQERWASAKLRLAICLLLRPEFVWARLLRGLAHTKAGDFDTAEIDFRHAEEILDRTPNARAQYALCVERAEMHLRVGSLDRAAADLRQAIRIGPNQYAAHMNLAEVLHKQNHRDQAADHLRKAVALGAPAPSLARFHTGRGRDLIVAGRYEEAVAECRQALKHQPGWTLPLGVYGEALLKLRRFSEAAKVLDEYLTQGGTAIDAHRARGQARMQIGDPLGAVDDYTQVVLREPSSEIHAHRGWAYFFADAFRPAQRDFDRAIRLDRDNTDAYIGRALSQVMLGKVSDAIADADLAQARKPATPDMMHNLACVYALATTKVEADTKQPERVKLVATYRATAMKLVHATLALAPEADRGRLWREMIVPDTAMDSLRHLADFKQLMQVHGQRK
jgi:serine/threonine protein kinase/Tfp pilus assembly protein PilF